MSDTINAPFVFVSYAHKDSALVLPCIEALRSCGVHIWYDDGIEAGSEWPEFIAEKVLCCSKFVLFVTDAYLASQNCKRELNFAISRSKDILTIYLKDVSLSPGMEMQLGSYQAFFRNRFPSSDHFINALCQEHYFDPCRRSAAANTQPDTTVTPPQPVEPPAVPCGAPSKSRMIAFLLSLVLGFLGAHKFYLGQKKKGQQFLIFYLACLVVSFILFGGFPLLALIPYIMGLSEGIHILRASEEALYQKYGIRFTR